MARLSSHLCVLLVLLAALLNPASSSCLNHVPLFTFGDVIFDQGNNNYVNTSNLLHANMPPYGETFFKFAQGRFSDGRLISDFIAEFAGLPPILPYLNPSNNLYIYGANFASGGCAALEDIQVLIGQVVPFKEQIEYYKKVVTTLKLQLGYGQARQLVSNAVHLFSIGNSDYLSIVLSGLYDEYTFEQYVEMVIGNITAAVREVYNAGGRKFGFMSLGTLGCFPNIRQMYNGSCNENGTILANMHNIAFPIAIQELQRQLPGFIYSYFDYYAVASTIMNTPEDFGISVVDKGCCGTGAYNGDLSCGRVEEYNLCDNPNEYVFWDSGHGTDRVNEIYANFMWTGNYTLTWPYNLRTLFQLPQRRNTFSLKAFQNILSGM